MSIFDDHEFMAQAKREIREFMVTGQMPQTWNLQLPPEGRLTMRPGPKATVDTDANRRALAALMSRGVSISRAARERGLNANSIYGLIFRSGGRAAFLAQWGGEK